MECIAQYLDDLEDLCYAFVLIWERIRRTLHFAFFILVSVSLQAFGVVLALTAPPLAIATVALLLVWLLYRGAVSHHPNSPLPA